MALLQAMMLVGVLTMAMVGMISYSLSTFRVTRATKAEAQAYNVARAGLVDAIAWFKRQENQPVTKFDPVINLANVLKSDTYDPLGTDPGGPGVGVPGLGLVQEFELDAEHGLWGRYEVGKVTRLTKGTDKKLRTYRIRERHPATNDWVDKPVAGATANVYEGVQDVTEDYGFQGAGTVWRIRSHGYVYRKDPSASATTPFYAYPNEVLDQLELNTEIFRLQFRDYGAAIATNNGPTTPTTVTSSGVVKGGPGYGLLVNFGPLNATTSAAQISTESPSEPATKILDTDAPGEPKNRYDWLEVFGVADSSLLASLADYFGPAKGTTGTDGWRNQAMAIVYLKPPPGERIELISNSTTNLSANGHRALGGGGLLIVDGDLFVSTNSANNFNGYIYVTGNADFRGLQSLSGSLVVKGSLYMNPTNYEYNPALLLSIRRRLAQYRERRGSLKIAED